MRNSLFVPIVFLVLTGEAAAATRAPESCPAVAGAPATVVSIDERLELTLDTGARLRVAGVEPPRATPANPRLALDARDRLSAWLVGLEVRVRALSAAPDRWGRQEASVAAPAGTGGPVLSVAEALVDAGLARTLPEPSIRGCAAGLLAREQAARDAGLGLWRDPAYSILPAEDRSAFQGRGGEIVLVEGVVTGIGETRARTYVNFGEIRSVDFSLTIRRQTMKTLESAGLRPADFRGRALRVRGQLDTRFGPQIEVMEPSAIEFTGGRPVLPQSGPPAGR